jgi:dTDP-glucose 4,6-dehydratase
LTKTRIAIIGSHSFSGNAYAAHVLENEACLTVSRSKKLPAHYESRKKSNFPEQKIVWNLNHDANEVIKAIQKNKITTIVNFAAQSMVGQSWVTPEDWYETNVVSLSKFINRLQNETTIEKFIHFTTPEVYGSTEGWVTENFDFAPNTPYAISRAAGDWHLRAM